MHVTLPKRVNMLKEKLTLPCTSCLLETTMVLKITYDQGFYYCKSCAKKALQGIIANTDYIKSQVNLMLKEFPEKKKKNNDTDINKSILGGL